MSSLFDFVKNAGEELFSARPLLVGAILDADGDGDFDMGDAAKHGLKALGKLFGK